MIPAGGPKPPWWKRRWVIITASVFLALVILGNLTKGDDPKPKATTTTTEYVAPTTIHRATTTTEMPVRTTLPRPTTTYAPPPVHEVTYSYAQLSKDADGALFMNDTVGNACVFQFDSATGSDAFMGEITDTGYGWDDVVYFTLDDSSVGDGIYQGDLVRYHGYVYGSYDYQTQAGGTKTVPQIQVSSMTKIGTC
jgi:hypothetical protein